MKLVFKNVSVVSEDGVRVSDVFVDGGKIMGRFDEDGARVIDGTGKFLMPGAIDAHVHFREPGASHKETWETGSRAAVMGGVTSVLDMPNNSPAISSVSALEAKRDLVRGKSYCNYGFHFAATGNLDELEKVAGIAGVKIYMGSSTGDLLVDNPGLWKEIFTIAKGKNVPVIVHAEDEKRIKERMTEFVGQDDAAVYSRVRDCECAKIAVLEAIKLRERVGNHLHIAHLSCAEELELVRHHKSSHLSCEVAPHHLYFSSLDMKDSFLKMNPPLRDEKDLVRLWEGLRDGTVTCVATDHAPHTIEEKSLGIWDAPAGVPSVEFVLPLLLNEVHANMLTFEQVVRLLCVGPADIFHLWKKGRVELGFDADLVLVDMEMEKTIDREMVQSKCGWSPYEGYKLKGWPVMTIVNGEIVMEDREIVGGKVGKELYS